MSKRVNNEPLRAMAERMFVEESMTAKSIALALDLTEQTVGRWRKGIQGDVSWDDKRVEYLSAPNNLRKILMKEANHLSGGGDPTIDVKSLMAVTKMISSLSDKANAQIAFTVLKELDNYLAQQDPEFAVRSLEFHRMFLLHKVQNEAQ